jgi:hypothetical protein
MKRIPKSRTLGVTSVALFGLIFVYPFIPRIGEFVGMLFCISIWFSAMFPLLLHRTEISRGSWFPSFAR